MQEIAIVERLQSKEASGSSLVALGFKRRTEAFARSKRREFGIEQLVGDTAIDVGVEM